MDEHTFQFGAVESIKDPRTVSSTMIRDRAGIVPETGIVKLNFPQVNTLYDQLRIGVCTAAATSMSSEENKRDGIRIDFWWQYIMQKVYYDDPMIGINIEGSSALVALKVMKRYGCVSKAVADKYPLKIDGSYAEFWQSFITNYHGIIPAEILADAAQRKIPGYYEVPIEPMAIAKEISSGKTLIGRMSVGDNFYRDKNGKYSMKASDLLPLRAPKRVENGHLVVLNEYRGLELTQWLGGPNSWGTRFCKDNKDQPSGYFNFRLDVQLPFLTELWAIMDNAMKFEFTRSLKKYDVGPDVVALQKVLEEENLLVMPLNVPYGYFGKLTEKAVKDYQVRYFDEILKPAQLTKPTGVVGHFTIAHLNKRNG